MSNDTIPTPSPSAWRLGTVTAMQAEAPQVRSFTFTFETPVRHDAGQHYEIRLTAADGYQAARLYSAAQPADGTARALQLTIALMPHGEVSPYLFRHVRRGDQLELRGPLGRYFIWTPDHPEPALLVGGGTGVVPLRAIRLARQQAGSAAPMRLLYSVGAYADILYKPELFPAGGWPADDVSVTFTNDRPAHWTGYARRIDAAMLSDVLATLPPQPRAYVCGPTPLVEAITQLLVRLGHDPAKISAERFGATG